MTRPKNAPREGSSVWYSRQLGMCDEFVYNYKYRNKHIKSYKQVYSEVNERIETQKYVLGTLEDIFYELQIAKKISKFGRYLVNKGLAKNDRSIHVLFGNVFMIRRGLATKEAIDRYRIIIKEYDSFKRNSYETNL